MSRSDIVTIPNDTVCNLLYNIRGQIVSVIYDYLHAENINNDIIQPMYHFNVIWLDMSKEHYIKISNLWYNKNTDNIDIRIETKTEIYTYNIDCGNVEHPIIMYNIISDWYDWFRQFVMDRINEL